MIDRIGFLVVACWLGCGGPQPTGPTTPELQQATSGSIGCPANEITITNDSGYQSAAGIRSYTATCRDRVFQCTGTSTSMTPECKEDLAPAPVELPPPPPP